MKRVLKELYISRIAAVTHPCQEGAVSTIMKVADPDALEKIIQQKGDKWCLYSHDGKKLGEFDSEEEAKKREAEIKSFAKTTGLRVALLKAQLVLCDNSLRGMSVNGKAA